MTWTACLTSWLEFFFLFLIDFFLKFILQHWTNWGLCFMICFNFIFMRLFQSHNSSHVFDWLMQVDSSCFYIFFINFFMSLEFGIYFNLFFIGYLGFMNQAASLISKLGLIRVNFFLFINWFFFKKICPSTLGLLKIEFHNLFWFTFYKVIMILWLSMLIERLIWIDSNRFNIFVSSQYL